jgi:hypothetical protein
LHKGMQRQLSIPSKAIHILYVIDLLYLFDNLLFFCNLA